MAKKARVQRKVGRKGASAIRACLDVSISKAPAQSFCMDGVTHLLHSFMPLPIRLRPYNDAVRKLLKSYEDAKIQVTVCGAWANRGPCSRLDVYYVGVPGQFKKFKSRAIQAPTSDDVLPWPW